MNRLIAAASLALALVPVAPALAADPTRPIDDPIPGHIEQGAIRAQLQVKAFGSGLTAPLYGTFAPGPGPAPGETTTQPDILYVVDQDGPLWAVDTRTGPARSTSAASSASRSTPTTRSPARRGSASSTPCIPTSPRARTPTCRPTTSTCSPSGGRTIR